MSARDGGHAFPNITPDMRVDGGPGMSLRGYFAAKAMQGLLSQEQGRWELMLEAANDEAKKRGEKRTVASLVALFAVGYADALIAELEHP
jgi:hypothetical protein